MSMPFVEIILVNYKGTNDTVECIQSLESITYDNIHVTVVDNSPELDKTLQEYVVLKKKLVTYYFTGANLGFSGGNNYGIMKLDFSKADFVLLLNNDTLVTKDFLQELLEAYYRHDNIGITSGKIMYNDNRKRTWYGGGEADLENGIIKMEGYNLLADQYEDSEREVTFATGCLMLIPKEVIQKVGMLSEEYFMYSEDVDYCCTVRNAGYRILYSPKSVIYHKVSASTSRDSKSSQYYKTKNDFFVTKKFVIKKKRTKSYILLFINVLKRIKRGNLGIVCAWLAIRDFILGRKGKNLNI